MAQRDSSLAPMDGAHSEDNPAANFGHLKPFADLENEISNRHKASELMSDDHPDKPGYLSSFVSLLQNRFECLGNPGDLENAISSHHRAVELTPDGHPGTPLRLGELGRALYMRFEQSITVEDLNNAILNLQKAVKLAPEGHQDTPSFLSNLGNALLRRFERDGTAADLNIAILNQILWIRFSVGKQSSKKSSQLSGEPLFDQSLKACHIRYVSIFIASGF